MNKLLLAILLVLISGCEPYTEEKFNYILPPELSHCKIYAMSDGSRVIRVVHCPNATTTTTYKEHKRSARSVTVIAE